MATYMEYMHLENLSTRKTLKKKIDDIKALGKLRSKAAVPTLTSLATDPDRNKQIRINSILALTEIGDKEFLEEFKPFNNIKDQDILELVIIAVSKLHAVELLPQYSNFVNSNNKELELKILEILEGFENIEAVKVLLEFVKDKNLEMKNIAKRILKKSNLFRDYVGNLNELETLNVITLIPKEEAEELINRMIEKTEDKHILKLLIPAIGDLKLKKSVSLLKNLYNKHQIKEIRLKIIESLDKNIGGRSKEFFLDLLNNPDTSREIKVKIIFGLENYIDDKFVIEEMFEIIENSDQWWMLRKVAILVLSNTLNKSGLDRLIKVLKVEEDDRVIRTLIEVMGDIGSFKEKKYIRIGRRYLKSKSNSVKKVAILALSKLGDKKVLEVLLNDKTLMENMMPDSLKALINFYDPRTIDILLEQLDSQDDTRKRLAITGLAQYSDRKIKNKLIRCVKNENLKRELKTKVIMILSTYRSSDVTNLFKDILEDEYSWWMLKKVTIIAIGEQNNYPLVDNIIDLTQDLDDRISKNAKGVAKKFYKNRLLNGISDRGELQGFAEKYVKMF